MCLCFWLTCQPRPPGSPELKNPSEPSKFEELLVPNAEHLKVSPRARGFVNPEDTLCPRQKPPHQGKKKKKKKSLEDILRLCGPQTKPTRGLNLALHSVSFSHLYHLQHLPGDNLQDTHYVLRAPPPTLPHYSTLVFLLLPRVCHFHSRRGCDRDNSGSRTGVFNSTCVCSAGTFSVASLRGTAIKRRCHCAFLQAPRLSKSLFFPRD